MKKANVKENSLQDKMMAISEESQHSDEIEIVKESEDLQSSSLFSPLPSTYGSSIRQVPERTKVVKRKMSDYSPSTSYKEVNPSKDDEVKREEFQIWSPAQSFKTLIPSPSESYKTLNNSPEQYLKVLPQISYNGQKRILASEDSKSSLMIYSPTLTINELKEENKESPFTKSIDLTEDKKPEPIKQKETKTIKEVKPFVENSTRYIDGIRGLAMFMV